MYVYKKINIYTYIYIYIYIYIYSYINGYTEQTAEAWILNTRQGRHGRSAHTKQNPYMKTFEVWHRHGRHTQDVVVGVASASP